MPRKHPGLLARIWAPLYEAGYACARCLIALLFAPIFGVRLVGRRPRLPRGPVIVCANHASYLDPVFLQLVISRRVIFVMNLEWYAQARARWFFRLTGAVPVAAGSRARGGLRRALELLRAGRVVGIFPEGRLSRDGTMGRGQRGVALLARMGRAPVVPVGIAGSYRAWPRGAGWLRRSRVRLACGPTCPPPPSDPLPGRREEQAYVDLVMARIAQAGARARPPLAARD